MANHTHDAASATWFDAVRSTAASAELTDTATWTLAGIDIRLGATSEAVAEIVLDGIAGDRSRGDGEGDERAMAGPRWVAIDGRDHPLPTPPFGPEDLLPRDGVAGFTDGRFRLAWAIERQVLWGFDVETKDGFIWMRHPALCAPWDRAAPWRPIASWWLSVRGAGLVHAAAVAPPGRPDLGILLVGPGGSGKSTLALACAAVGWTITGDDYVVVRRAGESWAADAPYRWAKASPDTIALLDVPRGWLVPGVDHLGKSLIDLPAAFGGRGAVGVGLAAVVAPTVAERTGSAVSIHPAGVMAALGPSTALQTPGDGTASLRFVAGLSADLPAWSLDVGPDVARGGAEALLAMLDSGQRKP